MEALRAVSGTQLLFPAVAVAAVLLCAALVFALGFRTPVEPAFDKSPMVQDDRKKRKTKDKKPSPNRSSGDDSKKSSDSSKKSPAKEKKEEKAKEPVKPKEKQAEPKPKAEKKEPTDSGKNKKKNKVLVDEVKPVDFDDGEWEEVPKKEKKKPKQEEKKESPAKKNKKKSKDAEEVKEAEVKGAEEKVVEVEVGDVSDKDEVNRELRERINELKLVLKEAELRDNAGLQAPPPPAELPEKELPKDKKKKDKKNKTDNGEGGENAEKENIPEPAAQSEEQPAAVVFDELGDTWSEAKVPKKSKKKVRKE